MWGRSPKYCERREGFDPDFDPFWIPKSSIYHVFSRVPKSNEKTQKKFIFLDSQTLLIEAPAAAGARLSRLQLSA